MSRVNIVKRIKIGGRWKMFSIPRNAKGNYDWNAIADGRYYVEWYVGGIRRRVSAGVTAAQALEYSGASTMNFICSGWSQRRKCNGHPWTFD